MPSQVPDAPWYYGNLTREEAEEMMGAQVKPGTFLVRKSAAEHEYILSIKAPEGGPSFRHLAMRHTSKDLFKVQFGAMEEREFSSMNDVIDHFQVTPITFDEDSPDVVLTNPWNKSEV